MKIVAKIAGAPLVCMFCGCANVLDQNAALATAPYTIEDDGRIVIETEVVGSHRSKPEYSFFMSSTEAMDTPELPTLP